MLTNIYCDGNFLIVVPLADASWAFLPGVIIDYVWIDYAYPCLLFTIGSLPMGLLTPLTHM